MTSENHYDISNDVDNNQWVWPQGVLYDTQGVLYDTYPV